MATFGVHTYVETLQTYDGWAATLFAVIGGDQLQRTTGEKFVIATSRHPDSENEAVSILLKGFLGGK